MLSSKYGSFLTVLLGISITGIVVLLGFYGYDVYKKYNTKKEVEAGVNLFEAQIKEKAQEAEEDSNENQLQTGEVTNPYAQIEPTNIPTPTTTTKSVSWGENQVIGKIEIPATGLKSTVLDRVSTEGLEKGICMFSENTSGDGDTVLNQAGNISLAGHNYRNGTMFSNNNKLKIGDLIYITDTNGKKVTYEVYFKQELPESDSSYITRDTNGAKEISLSTCTNNENTRLVILAREKK